MHQENTTKHALEATVGIYAHGRIGAVSAEWQTLESHCRGVASLCEGFASVFNSGVCGRMLGSLHDIGKARHSFQAYLRQCLGGCDSAEAIGDKSHSGAGACWLWNNAGGLGRALAYCVAGHHAGLPDWSGGENPDGALVRRLENDKSLLSEEGVADYLRAHKDEALSAKLVPPFLFDRKDSSLSFWIRMMFSCLVDADYLDTEAYMSPLRAATRAKCESLEDISKRFKEKLDAKQNAAADTPVNRIRAEIRSACDSASGGTQGIYSLTVPTGGGKTLSGTSFALNHAIANEQTRIIYVIPYTSIIEQTSDILRAFLGTENVIEHHSNINQGRETLRSKLASENWDAPVVVTTAVQFFESLHACRPSRCRKLHNIANSVVILDEVQLLPTNLLLPCAEAIRQLSRHYHTTVVLSTATQLHLPGIEPSSVREIIPTSLDLYRRLKRVNIEFPTDTRKHNTWDVVAVELSRHDRVLCIVNSRRDCRTLFALMPKGTIHLSAAMCGEHRSRAIAAIKEKLAKGEQVRVVSTQLVEAGVDIDFPIVYRAFCGMSSVAQSAGRCNREGRLSGMGRVVVFMPPQPSFVKDLRDGEYAMHDLLARPGGADANDARTYPAYFEAVRKRANDLGRRFSDYLGSGASSGKYQFREAAAAFRLIDEEAQIPVIVRYGEGSNIIEELRTSGPSLSLMRRAQRYTVNVPSNDLAKLLADGIVAAVSTKNGDDETIYYVQSGNDTYNDDVGLDIFCNKKGEK